MILVPRLERGSRTQINNHRQNTIARKTRTTTRWQIHLIRQTAHESESQGKSIIATRNDRPRANLEQETNNNCNRKDRQTTITRQKRITIVPVNKRITIAKCKPNHYRMAKDKPITITGEIYNRKPKKAFTIANRKANRHHATTDAKHKVNDNRKTNNK